MSFNVRTADLDRLHSLTEYPSIPTYHALDPQDGRLLEDYVPFDGPALLTEKIDGTNARIACLPDGAYLLGRRGEFLLAKGDLIGNPALGIVEVLRQTADRLCMTHSDDAVLASLAEAEAFLARTITRTYAALDAKAGGMPEGLVVRTRDRARIAKLRFSDYRRTLKQRK